MSITQLDEQVALLIVDLQVGTLANPTAHPVAEVLDHTMTLLKTFRDKQLPVVLLNVEGTPAGRTQYGAGARQFPPAWSALAPELDAQASDIKLSRSTWSAFAGTDLDAQLKHLNVTQIVIAGVATSFGVESTARHAYDLGYHVIIAVDAVTDPSMDAHVGSTSRVFPALGQAGETDEIVNLLHMR